jgi:hypothetical protein
LDENKWDCAEAAELTKWTRTLATRCDKLPASAIDSDSEVPLKEVFSSTNVVRHTAVHRLSTSARGIHKMIHSASRLAQTLGDHLRAAELENLHLEVGSRIRDMELTKNFLENRLDEQLRAIYEQRAELDRKEKEAIAVMLSEDQENKLLIGSFLEDTVSTFRRAKTGRVKSTNMTGGVHECDKNDEGEHVNAVEPGLANGVDVASRIVESSTLGNGL